MTTTIQKKYLQWFDLIILTLILFGQAIYSSTYQYYLLSQGDLTLNETTTFSASDNYNALIFQLILLSLALFYLKIRNFNLSNFRSTILLDRLTLLKAVSIFLIAALIMDLYYFGTQRLFFAINWIDYSTANSLVSTYTIEPELIEQKGTTLGYIISIISYALLNGIYEELFFLGICLAVAPKYLKWAIVYSLIIRCSFHTYQGMTTALGLGFLLGLLLLLLYRYFRPKNLLPFFLAHTLADIFGLSIWYYL